MQNLQKWQSSDSLFSRRRLGAAGIAALIGCVACCSVPLLVAAGLSGSVLSAITFIFRPGSELLIGAAFFAGALAVMAFRRRTKRDAGCCASCKLDGSCCDRGAAAKKSGSGARVLRER